jgi:hypothetical protein
MIFCEKEHIIKFLQMIFGYLLIGNINIHKYSFYMIPTEMENYFLINYYNNYLEIIITKLQIHFIKLEIIIKLM